MRERRLSPLRHEKQSLAEKARPYALAAGTLPGSTGANRWHIGVCDTCDRCILRRDATIDDGFTYSFRCELTACAMVVVLYSKYT